MLRAADGGVLFLDEVGELGGDEQSMLLMAIEEKRFFPMGSDSEASSDFQLICGTNRDLHGEVAAGRFRADLLARINLWTFAMPGLRDRPEDIAPNLDFELEKYARRNGERVSFNAEARRRFLDFAISGEAAWAANFRDLNGAVTRMATLCRGGRITVSEVDEEIERLRERWEGGRLGDGARGETAKGLIGAAMGEERAAELDRFDRVQLADVLSVVRESRSLSEAGRTLFAVSRRNKEKPNDSDRLRKYLAKFGIDWRAVR
jgi:transcriptional regulatory protein RtcR